MTQTDMTIGFFGDSFCRDIANDHSINNNYNTYLEKVASHFGATITNTGIGGSGVWDLVLIQFEEQVKKGLPDVCVFVWTEPHRIFHRTERNINLRSTERSNTTVHNAAKQYYRHLHDWQKHYLECKALFYYFDREILPQYKDTKFIHMWSFGEDPTETNPERTYIYNWQTGVEIRPALEMFSYPIPEHDLRANHIEGDKNNQTVANWIIAAVNRLQALPPSRRR